MTRCVSLLLAVLMAAAVLSGCAKQPQTPETPQEEAVTIRVGGLKGPTSMGLVKLLDDAENQKTANAIDFQMAASANELTPLLLQVVHVDLYFFYGVDIVLLNVEVSADDLPLPQARELMYRFGRAYPAGWDADGQPLHCPAEVEWLDREGRVVAHSDTGDCEPFLAHVAEHRAPRRPKTRHPTRKTS